MSEEFSETLQIVIQNYFPEGLPTEEYLNTLKEQNDQAKIDQIYQLQNNIISDFRRFSISDLNRLQFKIMRETNKLLNIEITEEKEDEEKKIEKTTPQKSQNKSSQTTPQNSPQRNSTNTARNQSQKTQNKSAQTTPQNSPQRNSTKTPKYTPSKSPSKSPNKDIDIKSIGLNPKDRQIDSMKEIIETLKTMTETITQPKRRNK